MFKVKENSKNTQGHQSRLGKREMFASVLRSPGPRGDELRYFGPWRLQEAFGLDALEIWAVSHHPGCHLWWLKCFLSSIPFISWNSVFVFHVGGNKKIKCQRAERPRYVGTAAELKVSTRVQNSTREPSRNPCLLCFPHTNLAVPFPDSCTLISLHVYEDSSGCAV